MVPPANPPDKKEEMIFRRFLRSMCGRLDGRRSVAFNMGAIAVLYQSMSMKLSAVAPACRTTLGVLPRQNATKPSSL